MKKSELKSFDITTYDIEIDFNKKIAPLEKKIDKLDKTHESKSLKVHKSFLTKEKKSKEKLKTLDEKLILKNQRIEKATANKIKKFQKHETDIKTEFDEYKVLTTDSVQVEIDRLKDETAFLHDKEKHDTKNIQDKYSKNVTSYIERLNLYNNNFTTNKETFKSQYKEYERLLNENLNNTIIVRTEEQTILDDEVKLFIESKEQESMIIEKQTLEVKRLLSSELVQLKKESNLKKNEIKQLIVNLKKSYETIYKDHIKYLEDESHRLSTSFDVRKLLINKDLEIHKEKLEKQIIDLGEKKNKKTVKSIQMKRNLFDVRAATVIEYEELMLQQKQSIIEEGIDYYKNILSQELENLNKLQIFFIADEDEMKNIGDSFTTINRDLIEELSSSEIRSNNYHINHEQLKKEFLDNYLKEFDAIKNHLIEANKNQILQLETINSELDDIDKFLDTVEPLKEIELNHLRESIETSEVKERYNIKYAKQDYEIKILQSNLRRDIALQELTVKELLSDNNMNITILKGQETQDKLTAQARLKFDKAEEIFKLRSNSIKLEKSILNSSYETEIKKADIQKDLSQLEVEKDIMLQMKDIDNLIASQEQESEYKEEVINKQLEESMLNFQEEIDRIERERDSFVSSVDAMVQAEEDKVDLDIIKLNEKMDLKLQKIDEALEREIKDPTLNIARGDVIIKERVNRFEVNDQIFFDFIHSTRELMHSDNLTPDQIKELVSKNTSVTEKAHKYLDNSYEILIEAVTFMNDLEQRSIINQIEAYQDTPKAKRLSKILLKKQQETQKQIKTIESSKKERKTQIKQQIKTNLTSIGKQENITEETLKEQVNKMYNNTFTMLKTLQNTISDEVLQLYKPLTNNDQELLDNAKSNAERAKTLVEKEREMSISPINILLGEFIQEKEKEKHKMIEEYNKKVLHIQEDIQKLYDKTSEQVKGVTKDQTKEIKGLIKKKQEIEETKTERIEEQINEISELKLALEKDYYNKLSLLEDKEQEGKKIFEYEERIYNIALENIETRYNDTINKAKQAIQKLQQDRKDNELIIKRQAERNKERYNKELINLTNEFEKNIFTVRPKYEESIIDAQKAIEAERDIKLDRRKELIILNRKMTAAIESDMYKAFKDTYEKLQANLNYYSEKYKIIEQEFFKQNDESGKRIIDIQQRLYKRVLHQENSKFERVIKELNKANDQL